ncbi:MAG TPA: 1,4-dihydroxy-2-naphthoate polyprenyltransferase [Polyangiaceae bacterium]
MAWVLAARPATLSAALVPVTVGTACAWHAGSLRVDRALVALAGALFLQVAANFSNDLSDFERGADTADRLGPTRAVQAGLLGAQAVRRGLFVVLGLAVLCGLYLWAVAGPVIVVIGLCSIASALAYTGGPYPLGYHGLGDLFVMIFFGFVAVCGTAWVQIGAVPLLVWPAALAVGSLATAILVVNNLRDRSTDAIASKRTLAVRMGRRGTVIEYALLVTTAYAVPVLLFALGWLGATALLPLFSLPFGVRLVARVARDDGRALNASLAGTARLLLIHGMLFAAGIALDRTGP